MPLYHALRDQILLASTCDAKWYAQSRLALAMTRRSLLRLRTTSRKAASWIWMSVVRLRCFRKRFLAFRRDRRAMVTSVVHQGEGEGCATFPTFHLRYLRASSSVISNASSLSSRTDSIAWSQEVQASRPSPGVVHLRCAARMRNQGYPPIEDT